MMVMMMAIECNQTKNQHSDEKIKKSFDFEVKLFLKLFCKLPYRLMFQILPAGW